MSASWRRRAVFFLQIRKGSETEVRTSVNMPVAFHYLPIGIVQVYVVLPLNYTPNTI